MNVFLSYALTAADLPVVTLIADYLRRKGFGVFTRYDFSTGGQYAQMATQIKTNLYIGVVTATGQQNKLVIEEWNTAKQNRIPSLLLVEQRIPLAPDLRQDPTVLRFNRNDPAAAIRAITEKRNEAAHSSDSNIFGWILGGLAAIALIKYLDDD